MARHKRNKTNPYRDQLKYPGGAWVHGGLKKRVHFPTARAREHRRR